MIFYLGTEVWLAACCSMCEGQEMLKKGGKVVSFYGNVGPLIFWAYLPDLVVGPLEKVS